MWCLKHTNISWCLRRLPKVAKAQIPQNPSGFGLRRWGWGLAGAATLVFAFGLEPSSAMGMFLQCTVLQEIFSSRFGRITSWISNNDGCLDCANSCAEPPCCFFQCLWMPRQNQCSLCGHAWRWPKIKPHGNDQKWHVTSVLNVDSASVDFNVPGKCRIPCSHLFWFG